MKKILVSCTALVFLLTMPFVLFSKETMNDSELDSTTAQEGVSIDFGGNIAVDPYTSNFAVFGQFIPATQSWGDGDGNSSTSYTGGGWIGMTNSSMSTTQSFIRAYTTMDIDVGTSGGITKTFIHMPQVLVHPANYDTTLKAGTNATFSDGQPAFGTIWNDQFAVVVNLNPAIGVPAIDAVYAGSHNGYISIGNHASSGGQGLDIGFGGTNSFSALYGSSYEGLLVSIPNTPIRQSWGDSDGERLGAGNTSITGYSGAGYFGSELFTVNSFLMLISGTMTFDVGTNGSGTTAVIIGLPTTRIMASSIDSPLVLSTTKYLSTTYPVDDGTPHLGTLHTNGIQMGPSGSLAILAH